MQTSGSEIAQLKQQIEQEYDAAKNGLDGISANARHAFIIKRMEQAAMLTCKLKQVAGDKEVLELLRRL